MNEHKIRNTTLYNECSANGDTQFSCRILSNEIAKSVNNEYYSDDDEIYDVAEDADIDYPGDVCDNEFSTAINPTLLTKLKTTNKFMKNNKHSMFLSNKMHNSCLNNLQFVNRNKLLDKIKQPFDVNCIERSLRNTSHIEQCHRKCKSIKYNGGGINHPVPDKQREQQEEYYSHAYNNFIICGCLIVAIISNKSFQFTLTGLRQLKDKLYDYLRVILSNINAKKTADTNIFQLYWVPFILLPLFGAFITVWIAYYVLKLLLKPVPKEWTHAIFTDSILKDI